MKNTHLLVIAATSLVVAICQGETQAPADNEDVRLAEEKSRQRAEQQWREAERRRREAERQMREAERQMREAERQMREASRLASEHTAQELKRALVVFDDRPRIGVVLRGEARPEIDAIGAEIIGVTPGGPAEEAGLKVGDIIVRVNGTRVAAAGDRTEGGRGASAAARRLEELLASCGEGEAVEIEVRRRNESRTFTLTPRRVGRTVVSSGMGLGREGELGRLQELYDYLDGLRAGFERWRELELTSLSRELGEYFGATEGVLVTRASSDSSLPLRPGDVILRVDGRPALSPATVLGAMANRSGRGSVILEVLRKGKILNLEVQTAPHPGPTSQRRFAPLAPAGPAVDPGEKKHMEGEL